MGLCTVQCNCILHLKRKRTVRKLFRVRHLLFIVTVQLKLKVDFHYCLIFAYVNRIEAMYERLCVNVMFARVTNSTLTRNLSDISSIIFTQLKITRQWKSTLRGS